MGQVVIVILGIFACLAALFVCCWFESIEDIRDEKMKHFKDEQSKKNKNH